MSECVAHLNITARAFSPILRRGLERARALGERPAGRYRRDPVGWALWASMGPPVRIRTRTVSAFLPGGDQSRDTLVADFNRLQDAQVMLLEEADGLPLSRIRIQSPFEQRVRYNLFACLGILARHQHRHLWQGERVWAEDD